MSEQLSASLKRQKYLALIPFFGLFVIIFCAVFNIKKVKDMPAAFIYFLICAAPLLVLFLAGGLLMLLINGQSLSITLMLVLDLVVAYAILLGCAYACYGIEIATLNK